MIEAGRNALAEHPVDDEPAFIVRDVFLAMMRANLRTPDALPDVPVPTLE
jgi:hypothetical protein